MNDKCSHCGFYFAIETGYFYVAMLISYAFNVAEMVTLSVAIYVLTGSKNPWMYTSIILCIAFVIAPLNFRYSRVVLLHWLTPGVHYEPNRSTPNYDPMHPASK